MTKKLYGNTSLTVAMIFVDITCKAGKIICEIPEKIQLILLWYFSAPDNLVKSKYHLNGEKSLSKALIVFISFLVNIHLFVIIFGLSIACGIIYVSLLICGYGEKKLSAWNIEIKQKA